MINSKFQLPEVGDKNLGIVVLGIVAIASLLLVGKDGITIAAVCVGAIGGFVKGDKKEKP